MAERVTAYRPHPFFLWAAQHRRRMRAHLPTERTKPATSRKLDADASNITLPGTERAARNFAREHTASALQQARGRTHIGRPSRPVPTRGDVPIFLVVRRGCQTLSNPVTKRRPNRHPARLQGTKGSRRIAGRGPNASWAGATGAKAHLCPLRELRLFSPHVLSSPVPPDE